MGYKNTPWSKTQYYRRKRRARELECSIYDLIDNRGKHNNHVSSSDHYRWNKKKIESQHGYIKIRVGVEHPLADPNGYVYEHLIVWCSMGNKPPSKNEILHHRNGHKNDNRIDNLQLLSRAEHNRLHMPQRDLKTGRFVGKKAAGRLLDGREWNEYPKANNAPDNPR